MRTADSLAPRLKHAPPSLSQGVGAFRLAFDPDSAVGFVGHQNCEQKRRSSARGVNVPQGRLQQRYRLSSLPLARRARLAPCISGGPKNKDLQSWTLGTQDHMCIVLLLEPRTPVLSLFISLLPQTLRQWWPVIPRTLAPPPCPPL